MTVIEGALGMAVLLLTAALMGGFAFLARRRTVRPLRPIAAFLHLRQAIGQAVEAGQRVHISLGRGNLLSRDAAAGLAALAALERLAAMSRVSDRPPVATSGEGALAILSQDALRSAYRQGGALEAFQFEQGRLTGVTPFSYAAGTIPVIKDEDVSASLMVGHFGPEIALLNDAAEGSGSFTLAASDSLPAQAVLYATADEPLIGEELFAIPAYLQGGPFQTGSLQAQDVLRWLLVVALLAGAVIRFFGSSLGLGLP